MKKSEYLAIENDLQVELVRFQEWIKDTGQRIIVVFEGRDAAGKGGVIKTITSRVSPRVFRVAALPKPSDREASQMYIQRYMRYFPSAGEIILFDRSWYNRLGVEKVMGFCSDEDYHLFLKYCPLFEHSIAESGITLIKYFFEVGSEEQTKRIKDRINDPKKQWKLSEMDLLSYSRWNEYTDLYNVIFKHTSMPWALWHVINSDNKWAARAACIKHLLSSFDYDRNDKEMPKLPKLGKEYFSNHIDDSRCVRIPTE